MLFSEISNLIFLMNTKKCSYPVHLYYFDLYYTKVTTDNDHELS